ncbi:MAG TPA: hypothetical protein VI011_18735 [Asanoa sp.]
MASVDLAAVRGQRDIEGAAGVQAHLVRGGDDADRTQQHSTAPSGGGRPPVPR